MSSKSLALRILSGLVLLAVLAGCSSAPTAAPTQQAPTVDMQPTLNAVQTQSARTVIADLTKNAPSATPVPPATATPTQAPVVPTATLAPTLPPQPTAAPTATWIPWTLTPTQATWGCTVTSTTPKLNTTYAGSSDFDTTWVVKNTGKEKWAAADVDVLYSSGTKMQKTNNGYDLPNDVASGDSYTVSLDMKTPADAGTYTDTWVISKGSTVLCTMSITVIVK